MKIILTFLLLLLVHYLPAQTTAATTTKVVKAKMTDKSIVKDSSGQVYQVDIWKKLLLTGYYYLKAENPEKENSDFILIRLSEAEKEKRLTSSPKPKESKCFVTGQAVKNFSTTDMDGNKIKLKELKGKVVVLNFWFINCAPCKAEIHELNKLVQEYKGNADVVFLAVALDDKNDLKDFLKRNPFHYTIIDSGRDIANLYDVTAYPTHAVIDQQGNAYFHTTGAGNTTAYWLKKSIGELMAGKN